MSPVDELALDQAARHAIKAATEATKTAFDELSYEFAALIVRASSPALTESLERAHAAIADAKADALDGLDRMLSDEMTTRSALETEIDDEINPEPAFEPDAFDAHRARSEYRLMGIGA